MVASNSVDPSVLKEQLMKTDGAYVTGNLTFDAKRNPVKSAVMLEIVKDGDKLAPVYKTTVNP